MQLAIVSDAWKPQVNGVETTLERTIESLETRGARVAVISPDRFRTIACPAYPEIRLALWPQPGLDAALEELAPDAIHVATEGPLGMAAARYCTARKLAFTTSYHTQFPQYVRQRLPVPWPSRRTSRRFSSSTCRARRWSSATAPIAPRSSGVFPRRISWASVSARSSRRASRPPTRSSFRAARTPSASCCSKRWPAARPSRLPPCGRGPLVGESQRAVLCPPRAGARRGGSCRRRHVNHDSAIRCASS
jgi:hypothetical protein